MQWISKAIQQATVNSEIGAPLLGDIKNPYYLADINTEFEWLQNMMEEIRTFSSHHAQTAIPPETRLPKRYNDRVFLAMQGRD